MVHPTLIHSSRKVYLDAVEEVIRHHKDKSFTYTRITQIPWDLDKSTLYGNLGELMREHYVRMLQMAQREESPDLSINIMKIKPQRLNSFMIVDRRLLTIAIDGTDSQGLTYMVGAFFLEDSRGKLIDKFARYFRNIERQAEYITLEELRPVELHNSEEVRVSSQETQTTQATA